MLKAPALKEDSAGFELYRGAAKRSGQGSCASPVTAHSVLAGFYWQRAGRHRLMPLVGRCSESPYAQVFSVGQARLSGRYIGPLLRLRGGQSAWRLQALKVVGPHGLEPWTKGL